MATPTTLPGQVALALVLEGVLALIVGAWSFTAQFPSTDGFVLLAVLTIFGGGGLLLATRKAGSSSRRGSGLVGAVTVWIALACTGAIPFWAAGADPLDGLFDAVSSITTTGVWSNASSLPPDPAIVLWRAVLQWGGGLVTIIIAVVIFLPMGLGGTGEAGRSSLAGPVRRRETSVELAFRIALTFVIFTLACLVLLLVAGLDGESALLYGLSAVATGGDPRGTPSMGFTPAVETILAIFMFAGATSFFLHRAGFAGTPGRYLASREIRLFVSLVLAGTAFAFFVLLDTGLSRSFFLSVSMATTSGIVPDAGGAEAAPLLLLALIGGSVASAAGGIHLRRASLLLRMILTEIRRLLIPHGVSTLKYGSSTVDGVVGQALLGFIVIWAATLLTATVLLSATGIKFEQAILGATAALTSTGPGMITIVGDDPLVFGAAGKTVLIVTMLLGRLEVMALLVTLSPSFWRR